MRTILDKALMHLKKIHHYKSDNPDILKAQIREYDADGKTLFQPFIISKERKFIVDRTSYLDIEEAKEVIEKYRLEKK